jgi:hypothetical protein
MEKVENENKCLYCGRILYGITPCDCGSSKNPEIFKLWDKGKRKLLRKMEKEE